MQTTRRIQNHIMPPLPAALLAAFLLPFLPGCKKTPEDHAHIAIRGDDMEKALASVQALDDQTLLAGVAANAVAHYNNTAVVEAALDKLSDERLLAEVAKNAYYEWRGRAVSKRLKKITDPQLLAPLVREARSDIVRVEAAGVLNDQAALADFAQNIRDEYAAERAVEKLTDQAALSQAAENGRSLKTRKAAVSRLTDQQALEKIVRMERMEDVRILALDRLDDRCQQVFADAARDSLLTEGMNTAVAASGRLRMSAVRRLTDQKLLAEVAKITDPDKARRSERHVFGARRDPDAAFARMQNEARLREESRAVVFAAFEKITDEAALADVAMNADYDEIRGKALTKMTDQKLMAGIVAAKTKDSSWVVSGRERDEKEAALAMLTQKITDEGLLAGIVVDSENTEIRDAALKKISGWKALAHVVQNAKDKHIRLAATGRHADPRALADIAANDGDCDVVWKALDTLDGLPPDPQTSAGLARAGNAEARLWAVWRLDDRELLDGLARNDADERVRNAVSAKLAGKHQSAAPENIMDLIKDGKLLEETWGGGIEIMNMRLRKTVPWPLEISIPAGTWFVSHDNAVKNMVSARDQIASLRKRNPDRGQIAYIGVACANMVKRDPEAGQRFTPASLPEESELRKLIIYTKDMDLDYATRQTAIWIVTDDAGYGRLHGLVRITKGEGINKTEVMIHEPEAACAMQLCAEAGIDIKKKRIWNDREEILAALPDADGDLKNWLADFAKP
jgi:uncharacterized DUF497 family protein